MGAPASRDPYGPPSYERRGYEPAYGDRYGSDRDRRPMPPLGGSPYDRRPPSSDYPPSRAGPDYRRRTPPPGPMGDSYGRFERDVYEPVPSDPYGSRRYPGGPHLIETCHLADIKGVQACQCFREKYSNIQKKKNRQDLPDPCPRSSAIERKNKTENKHCKE